MPIQSVPSPPPPPFVHFWTPVSGSVFQWLAGITISQLESHLGIATRQILSSCSISVSDAFTVNMNSKSLSYTIHCYLASTCVWLPFCPLSTEGWSHWSLYWEAADPHAADTGFPWRRCYPAPFWSKTQHRSRVPRKYRACWWSVSCVLYHSCGQLRTVSFCCKNAFYVHVLLLYIVW